MATPDANRNVVILGGGFAGAFSARYLHRALPRDVSVELICDRNYFVFQPLLPEVAAGTINALDAVTPLRLMLPKTAVRLGSVREVDFQAKTVELLQGAKRQPVIRHYDQLVVALGQTTDLSRTPGFAEHSMTMRDLADAFRLRNHAVQCLENADTTDDEDLKRRLLTFVVAGGGFSGVEVVGELADMIAGALRFYPNVGKHEIRVIVIQRGPCLLPELPDKLGDYAGARLSARGIDVMTGTSLREATASAVVTVDGEKIPTQTVVTTVGNAPTPLMRSLGLPFDRGKVETEATLAVPGYDGVWALGDCALVPLGNDGYAPPTAQFALREAKCVARNIAAVLKGQAPEPFDHSTRGAMASLGHYQGVAEVFGVRMSGLIAWLLWRSFYISMLPGFSTKLRVALNWAFDYVLPRNLVQLDTREERGSYFVHLAKGDVLFDTGNIVDGLYVVVSGCLESRVPGGYEDFVRIVGEGDHWGERSLVEDFKTQGTLTAVEDTRVLVIPRHDFLKIRDSLDVVDNYFKRIPDKIYPPGIRARRADSE